MRPTTSRTAVSIALAALAVGALGSLSACASSGGDSPTVAEPSATSAQPSTTSTTSASASATPGSTTADVTRIAITMTGSKVDPAPGRVKIDQGSTVELTVTRDTAGEIHVHGYDLEKQAEAGKPVTFTFVADQPGVFEVEAHDPDRQLTQLEVS